VIALSLRRQSPQNGNIRGRGRRLLAVDAPRWANRESGDTFARAKSRHFRPYLAFLREPSRTREWLAGDAVQIAPVSGQIPCKQGIFQGKSRVQTSTRQFQCKKPLRRRDFSTNSLSRLSGKYFRKTGKNQADNRVFPQICRPHFSPACLAVLGKGERPSNCDLAGGRGAA
jgi:hypothetical protein